MNFDYIEWDDESDPRGNIVPIEAADLTPAEVEEVLGGTGPEVVSRAESYRPAKMGWTSTGKYIFVVYERSEEAGIVVIYPVTAYEIDPP